MEAVTISHALFGANNYYMVQQVVVWYNALNTWIIHNTYIFSAFRQPSQR